MLTTVGTGLALRHLLPRANLLVITREAFVVFNIYGHAFSLIAAASTVIRRRDTTILILAATIMWGIFVAREMAMEMVRFLVFSSLIAVGIRMGLVRMAERPGSRRVVLTSLLTGVLCGAGGLAYHWAGRTLNPAGYGLMGNTAVALCWGFALGLAVALGISLGSEVVEWMMRRASR
jgi:hypothetical protein